jgi:hypothetical protein
LGASGGAPIAGMAKSDTHATNAVITPYVTGFDIIPFSY